MTTKRRMPAYAIGAGWTLSTCDTEAREWRVACDGEVVAWSNPTYPGLNIIQRAKGHWRVEDIPAWVRDILTTHVAAVHRLRVMGLLAEESRPPLYSPEGAAE